MTKVKCYVSVQVTYLLDYMILKYLFQILILCTSIQQNPDIHYCIKTGLMKIVWKINAIKSEN